MKNCMVAVVLLISLSVTTPLFSLDASRKLTQYVHDVWTNEDGLPQNTVEAILQTEDGYLWLATYEGLVRFDGVRFKLFNTENVPIMKGNKMYQLHEGRDGSLWVGSYDSGVYRYHEGNWSKFSTEEGLSNDSPMCLFEDREGNMWIGTYGGGLNRLKDGVFTTYTTKDGLLSDQVITLHQDSGNNLWVGTRGGLNVLKDGEFTSYTTGDGLLDDVVTAFYEDSNGDIWIGTRFGLNRFRNGAFTAYTTRDGLSNDRVYSIIEDRRGNLWLGTSGGGLNRFTDGKFSSFTAEDGLSNDTVLTLHEDREENLWIGTRNGLNRLRDAKITTYTTREGLSSDYTYSIYEDREENIWIGTNRGLNRLKDGKFNVYTTAEGLSHDYTFSIHQDRNGDMWIGTYGGGLNRLKGGKFTHFTTKDGLLNDIVYAVYEDSSRNLWVGTNTGLNRIRDGQITGYTTRDGLSHNIVVALHEDRNGILWIGTENGLTVHQNGKFTTYTTQNGLSNNAVRAIYEDAEGELWIGTDGGGLNLFRDGKFITFSRADGLFDNLILHILEDDSGNLWMSCFKGIFRVSKTELKDYAEGKIERIQSVAYGKADGMKNVECNGNTQPPGWKTHDGKLWFATIHGIAMMDPENIPTNHLLPPVVVEEFSVDDESISHQGPGNIVLSPGKEKFEIHYTALSLRVPERVRFRYKLEGYDRNWVEAGTRRVAYYTSLPPRQYNFRVMACNDDGVWNEAGAIFSFRLRPHFYQTTWFMILVGFSLLAAGAGSYRIRTRRLRQRQRELERVVEERTGQLQALNENLELRVQEGIDALREAERMAAYGQMVAGVAHEVRHPITALQAAAYVLQDKLREREDLSSQVGTLQRECKRMNTLMEDLLQFSKPSSILPSSVDPNALLAEAKETFETEHRPQNLSVVLKPGPELPRVVMDKDRILQVLVNLMANALKHAQGITSIILSVQSVDDDIIYRVENDGSGISKDHIPHLFEPFYTTGRGTGLGLAIVHQIVTQHGGTIRVESQPDKGSAFMIQLPLSGPNRAG